MSNVSANIWTHLELGLQQSLWDCSCSSCRFHACAVFNFLSVLPTSVFSFMCSQFFIREQNGFHAKRRMFVVDQGFGNQPSGFPFTFRVCLFVFRSLSKSTTFVWNSLLPSVGLYARNRSRTPGKTVTILHISNINGLYRYLLLSLLS
jgi:hypothetical protein